MKNRLFALTAAAVLAVSLTACGSKAEEPAAADTKTEAAEDTASADTTGDKKVLKVAMECGICAVQLDTAGRFQRSRSHQRQL